MSPTPRQLRIAARALHILPAWMLGFHVYLPVGSEFTGPLVQILAFPMLVISGLWIYKGQAVLRRVRRLRSRDGSASPAVAHVG